MRDLEKVLDDGNPILNPRVLGATFREADAAAADEEAVVGAKDEKEVVAAAIIDLICKRRGETAEEGMLEYCCSPTYIR